VLSAFVLFTAGGAGSFAGFWNLFWGCYQVLTAAAAVFCCCSGC